MSPLALRLHVALVWVSISLPAVQAAPVLARVAPDVVPYGHDATLTLNVTDLPADAQIAVAPGGSYVSASGVQDGAHALARIGDIVWSAERSGIVSYSADGQGRLLRRGSIAMAEAPVALAFGGGMSMLAATGAGLHTVDITDPDRPKLTSLIELRDAVQALALDGQRACVAAGTQLLVVEIAAAPRIIARHDLTESVLAVAIDAARCFVATAAALKVYEFADNGKVRPAGEFRPTEAIRDMAIAQGRIYLAEGDTGVTVLDYASDALRWRGSYNKLGTVVAVRTEGEHVLAQDDQGVLTLLDCSRAETPALVAGYRLPAAGPVAFAAGTAVAADATTLWQVDFSAAAAPALSTIGVNLGGSRRAFLDGGILYVADWFSGLHLYDVHKPDAPRLIASLHTPGSPKGVLVYRHMAYVADDDHGLQVVDVGDPRRPRLVASLPLEGLAYTMKRVGDRLYLAAHRGGFHIIDIRNPARPQRVGGYDTPGKSWAIEVVGNYAFVADDSAGLLVFDVRNAAHPKEVARFAPGGQAEDVVIREGLAYVAFFDQGLYALDVRDPQRPRQIGHLLTPGNARGIVLNETLAYIADWFAGVQVVDISEPHRMRVLDHYDTSGAAWGLALRGEQLFVLDWWGGVKVLHVGRDHPRLMGRYHGRGRINDIVVHERFAYTASGSGGVQVYDATNALNPVWATGVDVNGTAQALAVDGQRLFVATGDAGLTVIAIDNPFQAHSLADVSLGIRGEVIAAGNDRAYVAERGGALAVVAVDGAAPPRKLALLPLDVRDLAVNRGLLYVATPRTVEAWDFTLPSTPQRRARTLLNDTPRLVRAAGDRVFVYVQGRVLVLDLDLRELTSLSCGNDISAMYVDGARLYLSSPQGLQVWDLNSAQRLATYPTTDRIGAIALHDGAALLGGEALISSGRLLPDIAFTRRGAAVVATIPETMPQGVYDVVFTLADGTQVVRRNAFKVGFPQRKSKFTMEDLQNILKQKNFPGKAPMQKED